MTSNIKQRIRSHKSPACNCSTCPPKKDFDDYFVQSSFDNWHEAREYEKKLINTWKPKYNQAGNSNYKPIK